MLILIGLVLNLLYTAMIWLSVMGQSGMVFVGVVGVVGVVIGKITSGSFPGSGTWTTMLIVSVSKAGFGFVELSWSKLSNTSV